MKKGVKVDWVMTASLIIKTLAQDWGANLGKAYRLAERRFRMIDERSFSEKPAIITGGEDPLN